MQPGLLVEHIKCTTKGLAKETNNVPDLELSKLSLFLEKCDYCIPDTKAFVLAFPLASNGLLHTSRTRGRTRG